MQQCKKDVRLSVRGQSIAKQCIMYSWCMHMIPTCMLLKIAPLFQIVASCEEQCQHAVLEGHTRRLLGCRIFGPRPNPWTWTTEFTTIQNMSFHLVRVSSYHGSATWSFNGHATDFKCYKSSSPPGSCGGLSGEVGESVDMSTEPSRDICGINKKEYLEYAFNPLVLACPNPHPDLLQRHHGIAHYSIISVDQFIHFYVSHFYSIKIWK